MIELDKIYCGNCVDLMNQMPDGFIDLTVTSPPYDKLRRYNGYSFEFEKIASELFRVTKNGGVLVWIVGDATINGSETGSSFRQSLYFMEIGFNLHDTMIYRKLAGANAGSLKCYRQSFEYMFVLSKGKISTHNLIRDNPNKSFGRTVKSTKRKQLGHTENFKTTIPEFSVRTNVWDIDVGYNRSTKDKIAYEHPAIFPEKLAKDHILSWSNEGDIVFDPMTGSGTTVKMAKLLNRRFIGVDISPEYVDITNQRLKIIE